MESKRKLIWGTYLSLRNQKNFIPMADDQNNEINGIEDFLNLFNKESEAKLVFEYFEAIGIPFEDDNGVLMRLKDFYKEYCCDLQWAKDAGYCGNQGSSGTTETSRTTRTTTGTSNLPKLLNTPDKIKKFQDWLDTNHAGWATGYYQGKVAQGKVTQGYRNGGYGSFGPRTKRQWDNPEIKSEYLKYLGLPTGSSGQATGSSGQATGSSGQNTTPQIPQDDADQYNYTRNVDSDITNDNKNTSVETPVNNTSVNQEEVPIDYGSATKVENKNNMKPLISTLISNEEKNRILELHNKVKNYEFSKKISKILREQITVTSENDPEQKRFLINARTLCPDLGGPGVKLELHRLEDTEKFFLYKKDKDGLEYYYKPNGTVDIVSKKDGKATIVRKSTWYCQALVNQERNKKQEIPNQERQNFIDAGWTPIEDLRASGKTESEIRTTYRKHPKYELYMNVGDPNRIKGYSKEQQDFINAWTSNPEVSDNIERQVYKINPTAADFATGDWKLDVFFRAPNSEKYFEDGLKVYFNLSKKPEPTRSACKSTIKDFADKYKRRDSNPATAQYINYTRGFIQDCVNKYKFGGPLSGLNDELNLLGGITTGGAGRRSPWHIQLPE